MDKFKYCWGEEGPGYIRLTLENPIRETNTFTLGMDEFSSQENQHPHFHQLISPHIKEITSLNVTGLFEFEVLKRVFPNFPKGMDKLHKLELSLEIRVRSCDIIKSLSLVSPEGFCQINSLTTFTFVDYYFCNSLDTLFTFLKGNPSLENVTLWIGLEIKLNPCSRNPDQVAINLKQLQSLSVMCKYREDIKCLISYIHPPMGARLRICPTERDTKPDEILLPIPLVATSPTFMTINCLGKNHIDLTGPNGGFTYESLPDWEMDFILKGESPLGKSLEMIQNLILTKPPPGAFKPQLFPALKTLTIREDLGISTTLSSVFSSPGSFSLQKLVINHCFNIQVKDVMDELEKFKHQEGAFKWGVAKIYDPPSGVDSNLIVVIWEHKPLLNSPQPPELSS